MKILVINAGSSSLKFQLIDMDDESVKAKGLVERIGIEGTHFKQTVLGTDKVIEFTRNMKDHTEAISAVLTALTDKDNGAIASLDEIGACGHRVLHGGETFKESVLVTEESMKGIEELVPLGPPQRHCRLAGHPHQRSGCARDHLHHHLRCRGRRRWHEGHARRCAASHFGARAASPAGLKASPSGPIHRTKNAINGA